MPKVSLYDMKGRVVGDIELCAKVFEAPIRKDLMSQVLLMQLANRRVGTASSKTRAEVRGGGKKPWRQKGTGRARHGSIRSPIWKGGGITFGPKPRDYSITIPMQVRRMALRSALSCKLKDEDIMVLDELKLEAVKTKDFKKILEGLSLEDKSLVIMERKDEIVRKSAANLPEVKIILSSNLNIHDLMNYKKLVLTQEAVKHIEEVLGK